MSKIDNRTTRRSKGVFLLIPMATMLAACSTWDAANFIISTGYQPIDPLPLLPFEITVNAAMREIRHEPIPTGPETNAIDVERNELQFRKLVLGSLENETVRLAIGQVDVSGTVSFGPMVSTHKGSTYEVILDYVKYTTVSVPAKYSESRERGDIGQLIVRSKVQTDNGIAESESATYHLLIGGTRQRIIVPGEEEKRSDQPAEKQNLTPTPTRHLVPFLVGIGLRVKASILVGQDDVSISSFHGLGLSATEGKLTGSLVVETMGITGEKISASLPFPDQLSISSVQGVMQALATIKSKIYDQDTRIVPCIVGLDNPFSVPGSTGLLVSTIQSMGVQMECSAQGLSYRLRQQGAPPAGSGNLPP